MPRIRTLKPEHRQHRKVGPLSHIDYRLWVGMILEADDEGRLVCDARQLAALIFAYHQEVSREVIEASLNVLQELGLIRLYAQNGTRYADFPSWHDHQRIDHATASKLPLYDDSLKTLEDYKSPRESSRGIGRDRKGSEGKGKELLLPRGTPRGLALTSPAWNAYRGAYQERYRTEPIRNAKVNGMLASLVQRLPTEEVPDIAAFYVRHNAGLYVRAGHPVELLLRDAEKLHTEWATGRMVTETEARETDRRQGVGDRYRRVIDEVEQEERDGKK